MENEKTTEKENVQEVKPKKTVAKKGTAKLKQKIKDFIKVFDDKADETITLKETLLQTNLITLLEQIEQIEKIKKETKKCKVTSTKEYVKGRENIVINPLEKFLGECQGRKDKTVNTIIKAIKDLDIGSKETDELKEFLLRGKE